MKPLEILYRKNATRLQLRKALAFVLGVEYVEPENEKEEAETLFKTCLNAFLTRYEHVTKLEYTITAKDGKALNSIIAKIEKITKTGDVLGTFTYLVNHLPTWYVKNAFSLAVIDSKFNEIIASIKGSKSVSDGFKQQIINDIFK